MAECCAKTGKKTLSDGMFTTGEIMGCSQRANDYVHSRSDAVLTEKVLLNRFDRPSPLSGEAEVKFLDGDFRVVRPGAFVRCAVSGLPIPLEELRYWSVELQEAYSSPEAVARSHLRTSK